VDYNDLLDQKRREENSYRNGDPFVGGGMRSSSSEGFLNSHQSHQAGGRFDDSFNLGREMNELQGTVIQSFSR